MSNAVQPSGSSGSAPPAPAFSRLAIVAVLLAAVVGTFLWLGGWLTPNALTPEEFVDAFEHSAGVHPGFRRNHAKGVCVSGFFLGNGEGLRLSKAALFAAVRTPVIGRFSLGGGSPDQADAAATVRGLGLEFTQPDGQMWRMAMINLPVFPFKTPQAFYDQLVASAPDPKTGKPDPAKMEAFAAQHPETVAALKIVQSQPPAAGFADSTFRSLLAFRFLSARGVSTPVRWMFTPDETKKRAADSAPADAGEKPTDQNFLFDALIAAIHRGPLRWHLIIIVGQDGDPTADPTLPWPADREQIDVGTLTLDRVESDETGTAAGLNFDPLVLPDGIEPSDDPLLSARSAIYSQAFTRRAGESPPHPAVTAAEVKGVEAHAAEEKKGD